MVLCRLVVLVEFPVEKVDIASNKVFLKLAHLIKKSDNLFNRGKIDEESIQIRSQQPN